jgi:hypothetical protein
LNTVGSRTKRWGSGAGRGAPRGIPARLTATGIALFASTAAAQPPRLVVVDVSPEALPAPYEGVKLGDELGRALEAAGCRVERTCNNEECARGGAGPRPHVLSFDLRYDRKQFACSFSLEVRDGPGGRVEYREKASSPVCPAAEAIEDSRRAARVACDELRKTTVATRTLPAGPVAPARPAAGGNLRLPAPPPPLASDLSARALGTGIVAAGAAAMVGGAVLLYLNGQPTSCALSPDGERVCTRTRQTSLAAVPLLVVGAAGVGWGSWKLLSLGAQGGLRFGIAGRRLAVGGRF